MYDNMRSKIVLQIIVTILIYKISTSGAPAGSIEEKGIHFKLHLFPVPGNTLRLQDISSTPCITCSKLMTRTQISSVSSSPNYDLIVIPYRVRHTQPRVVPLPTRIIHFPEQNTAQSQVKLANEEIQKNARWGTFRRLPPTEVQPHFITKQPIVNYHYAHVPYVPATRLSAVPTKFVITTSKATPIVPGLTTSHRVIYGDNSGRSTATTFKPFSHDDLMYELQTDTVHGIDDNILNDPVSLKYVKDINNIDNLDIVGDYDDEDDRNANGDIYDTSLNTMSAFKNINHHVPNKKSVTKSSNNPSNKISATKSIDQGSPNKVSAIKNMHNDSSKISAVKSMDDDSSQISATKSIDDDSSKISAIRSLWKGYIPTHLLEDVLRQTSSKRGKGNKAQTSRLSTKRNVPMWRQFQGELKHFRDAITGQKRENEVESKINEMHSSDYDNDEFDEPEEYGPQATNLKNYRSNSTSEYDGDFESSDQLISQYDADKDPHGRNRSTVADLRSNASSNVRSISSFNNVSKGLSTDYNDKISKSLESHDRYVADNGNWGIGHGNSIPSDAKMPSNFNESLVNKVLLINTNENRGTSDEGFPNNNSLPGNMVVRKTDPAQNSSIIGTTDSVSEKLHANVGDVTLLDDETEAVGFVREHGNGTYNFEHVKDFNGENASGINGNRDINKPMQETEVVTSETSKREARSLYDRTPARSRRTPDDPRCKEVTDIDLLKNGATNETRLSHVHGILCVNEYSNSDEDEDHDQDEDRSEIKEYDESKEASYENESTDFDEE